MELSGRLKTILELLPQCEILCDIGTDHAYIPISAIKMGICRRAVAADVRPGPAGIAARNVKKHDLIDRIDVRVGNGLQPIGVEELDTVVIAGMGGLLITDILQESFDKAKIAASLLLQPMNAVEEVRRYLYENGFEICAERLAAEENKIYNILCVKWTGQVREADSFDCYIGPGLIKNGDEHLQAYLQKRLGQLNVAIEGMEKAKERPESYEEFREIRSRLLEYMKSH